MSSYTRRQLEQYLKTIDVKADRVLDIGGSQNPIKKRTKSWEVKDYKILDLEQPHECEQKPDIICDINNYPFSTDENKMKIVEHKRYFNVAFCIEVSEYWFDPMTALCNTNSFLVQGGILYISFHFIYPAHNPVDQDYLRYTPRGIEKLLKESGFEIEEMIPRLEEPNVTKKNNLMNWFKLQGMRPTKEYDKHNWVGCIVKARKIKERYL